MPSPRRRPTDDGVRAWARRATGSPPERRRSRSGRSHRAFEQQEHQDLGPDEELQTQEQPEDVSR